MTNAAAPTAPYELTVRPGTAGRYYVLEGRKVVHTARSLAEAEEFLYGPDPDEGVSWYCNHDVPNGCEACAADRNWNLAFEAMTDAERQEFLYGPGGTFESFFAPGGPAFLAGL